jgi:hypothetical protein
MDIEPFALERWLADYEHEAAVNLGDSGVRALEADRFDTDPGTLGYVVPTNGDPDLRTTVGDRYGREADDVLFTCGTQEANLLTVLATLDRDSHAVCVTPTYQSLHSLPEAVADVTRVELTAPDWTLDPDAVADAIEPNTDLVVLNNPNNPTGKIHAQETVEAVYDLAAATDAYLLSDEVYRPLAAPEERVATVASMGPHGISTCGLSKGGGTARSQVRLARRAGGGRLRGLGLEGLHDDLSARVRPAYRSSGHRTRGRTAGREPRPRAAQPGPTRRVRRGARPRLAPSEGGDRFRDCPRRVRVGGSVRSCARRGGGRGRSR